MESLASFNKAIFQKRIILLGICSVHCAADLTIPLKPIIELRNNRITNRFLRSNFIDHFVEHIESASHKRYFYPEIMDFTLVGFRQTIRLLINYMSELVNVKSLYEFAPPIK